MTDPRIVNFVRQSLSQGYDATTIKNHLLEQGFRDAEISAAMNEVYNVTEVKHVHHLSPVLLIILGIFVVALVAVGVYLWSTPEKNLLDLSLDGIQTAVESGKEIVFTSKISNLGSVKRSDVTMRYELVDKKQNLITFKEETLAVETSSSSTVKLQIPARTNPGSYILKGIAKYNGKVASASLPVTVSLGSKAASCYDGIKNQDEKGIDCGGSCQNLNCCHNGFSDSPLGEEGVDCGGPCNPCTTECDSCNDNNPCTEDVCGSQTNFLCSHQQLTPCCGNALCEDGEKGSCETDCPTSGDPFAGLSEGQILDKIKGIIASDPALAESYCQKYLTSVYKDQCFVNLATNTQDDSYCRSIADQRTRDLCYIELSKSTGKYDSCGKITNDVSRDSCYFNYASTTKDFSICDAILTEAIKRSCDTLKQISDLQQAS